MFNYHSAAQVCDATKVATCATAGLQKKLINILRAKFLLHFNLNTVHLSLKHVNTSKLAAKTIQYTKSGK